MERLTKRYIDSKEAYTEYFRQVNGLCEGKAIDKLAQYEDMEEQGRIVKLPCKVGDTIWDNSLGEPWPYIVIGLSMGNLYDDYDFETNELCVHYQSTDGSIKCITPISEFGKAIFLTEAEAEQAIAQMQ